MAEPLGAYTKVNLAEQVTNVLGTSNGGTGATSLTGLALTSPTLTTPVLGTPSSGNLANCTGLPFTGLASAVQADITSTSALAEIRKVYPSATAPTLTCAQNITNSQILTSTAIGSAVSDVIANGQVSIFDGCNMQHPSGTYPYSVTYRPYCSQQDSNGDTFKATGYSLGFYSESPEVEVAYVNRGNTTYRVWVDDMAVNSLIPATSSTTGNLESVLINFGTSKQRRYRVDLTGADLLGIVVSSVDYSLWPAEQRGPTVFFMGDSLFGGSAQSTSYVAQIPEYVGNVLGWDNVWNCGIGGTGYVTIDAPSSFNNDALAQITYLAPSTATPSLTTPGSSLPTPDVVVMEWGHNDTLNSTTYTAAGVAAATARSQWPNAFILLLSPLGSGSVGTSYNAGTTAIFAAAAGSVNATLSVWTGSDAPWMTGTGNTGSPAGNGNSDIYTGTDGVHWTDAGIAYMGQRLAPKLYSLYASWDAAVIGKTIIPTNYTQALSSTTYVMSSSSASVITFTGTSQNQTVTLPATATVGQQFLIMNEGTSGAVTCNASSSGTPIILAGGTSAVLTATSNTPTTAAGWDVQYGGVSVTSGKLLNIQNSLTFTGTDGSAIAFPSGLLAVANGGTGIATPGTSGNVLTSNGSGWVSSTPVVASYFNIDGGNSATTYTGDLRIDFGASA